MSLNKCFWLITFIHVMWINGYAQQQQTILKDSIIIEALETVVLTAQYSEQSIKKSVYEVTVIDRNQIDSQGGNNLADVLNQTLNISIVPNASTGKSSIELFGLDSQYVKILVDDIPLINDEGLGNNTDLTQINLDDIEQIEIVEGSMGVEYGANAVAGVINIITKKKSKYKWSLTPFVQEETIGDEYNLSDRGRHIQSIKTGYNFSDHFYGDISFTRNNFNGFYDDRKGESHQFNDGLRGHLWLPKTQNTTKALISYKGENGFKSFYKFEYFKEKIDKYSQLVDENPNQSTLTTNPIGSDEIFTSTRFYHHLNFIGKIKKQVNYNISVSYQQQKRDLEKYQYFIKRKQKFDINNFEYESRNVWYSKGKFSDFIKNEYFNFQLGYEINQINGFASSVSGSFDGNNVTRNLGSYDVYGSGEYRFSNQLSLRSGIRVLTSSIFNTQTALSVSAKYIFNNGYELRSVIGTSPRMPNYEELFTFFVDANHNVRGNSNLKPEQGKSFFLHLKKKINFSNIKIQSKLTANFINVVDRIDLIQTNSSPFEYKYLNIHKYNTVGAFLTNGFKFKNIKGSIGVGYTGNIKILDAENVNNKYLFSTNINTNLSYKIKNTSSTFSLLYKYNGRSQQFVEKRADDGSTNIVLGTQDGYSNLDASFQNKIFKNKLHLTLGVRNILNITQVNSTAIATGAHSDGASTALLGYGRSYFVKLLYNLNFN